MLFCLCHVTWAEDVKSSNVLKQGDISKMNIDALKNKTKEDNGRMQKRIKKAQVAVLNQQDDVQKNTSLLKGKEGKKKEEQKMPMIVSADVSSEANVKKEENVILSKTEKWEQSLLESNPFISKDMHKPDVSFENEWAAKRSSDLELFSWVKYGNRLEFGIRDKDTKRSCWLPSDKQDSKLPWSFVKFNEIDKALTVKNIVTNEMMIIHQEEMKNIGNTDSRDNYLYDDFLDIY